MLHPHKPNSIFGLWFYSVSQTISMIQKILVFFFKEAAYTHLTTVREKML